MQSYVLRSCYGSFAAFLDSLFQSVLELGLALPRHVEYTVSVEDGRSSRLTMQSDAAITTYLGCQCDGVVQLRAACQLVRRQLFPVYSNDRLPKTLTAIDEVGCGNLLH